MNRRPEFRLAYAGQRTIAGLATGTTDSVARQAFRFLAWFNPMSVLMLAIAIPWAGALIPLFVPTHYIHGIALACVGGVVLFLVLLRLQPSVLTSASLAVGAMLLAFVLGVVIVELAVPVVFPGEPAWSEDGDITQFSRQPAETVLWLFAGLTCLFWASRKWGRQPPVQKAPPAFALLTRCLVKVFAALILPVMGIAAGSATLAMCVALSSGSTLGALVAKMNDVTVVPILSDASFAKLVLRDSYFFENRIPKRTLDEISSPTDVTKLLDAAGDRFSRVGRGQWIDNSLTTGLFVTAAANELLRVTYVLPSSLADRVGFRRGDLVTICGNRNGRTSSDDCAPHDGTHLVISRASAARSADWIALPWMKQSDSGLPFHGVINLESGPTGYVLLTDFTESSAAAFEKIAKGMKARGVTDLIIDLRLNGGGLLGSMNRVAAVCLGPESRARPSGAIYRNERYSKDNGPYPFPSIPWSGLGLRRLVVLISGDSASASEVLIATLRDHIPVVTVGANTVGKGMGGRRMTHSRWSFYLLEFEIRGWKGTKVPEGGFEPDIAVEENFTLALGDPQEPLLKAALAYFETGGEGRASGPS